MCLVLVSKTLSVTLYMIQKLLNSWFLSCSSVLDNCRLSTKQDLTAVFLWGLNDAAIFVVVCFMCHIYWFLLVSFDGIMK